MTSTSDKVCKLCLRLTVLRNSHILPEFAYKSMYDEKHRFMVISPKPEVPIRRLQKGHREKLLCDKCEVRFSVWEKYVKEVIYDGRNVSGERHENVIALHGLDYGAVRLYYLSLLWRMGASTLPMFKEVELGPHAETLRRMLLDGDPGEPETFGFFCVAPLIDGRIYDDLIREPERIRMGGHILYRVIVGGLLLVFATNPEAFRPEARIALIQKNGDWSIVTRDARNIDFLNKWFTAQAEAERMRQGKAFGSVGR